MDTSDEVEVEIRQVSPRKANKEERGPNGKED